ncbi:hypothetical protein GCM10007164_08430 [Luteimonas padinae]|uniref:Energy transducer TonB n=1 Tax=Luteimonas padinae TaxID=1714359 RepID=A0ABV6T1Z3_9GAMM|nr:energy transducer TonB [Luteimonas padinae]GHD67826.1 hypothetical protein GCM10007164_08430 [Luteimonas padinae]
MVLQSDVRSPFPALSTHRAADDPRRPDPVRVAGIAGALLLNGAALMLMLAPLGSPGTAPTPQKGLEGEWFEPRPLPPPPPPPIVPVQRVPTPATPTAEPRRAVVTQPEPATPPLVEGGTLPADSLPPLEAGTGDADVAPAPGPAAGLQLAYAEASSPPYPRDALRSGHQGTVVLQVLVGVDGRPLEVVVETGSGYRELDEAARRHVLRRWRFQPAMRDGRAVQAIGLVPIEFRLDRG